MGEAEKSPTDSITVERATKQRMNRTTRMENNNDQSRGRKIFVGGLSAELTEDEFKAYFEKFGRIIDVVVMHDSLTNRPRGFGFITFDSVESVDSVLQSNFHELNGRRVEVKRAVPKKGNDNGGHIFDPRTRGGRSSVPYENVPFPYHPYYGSGYTAYPGFPPLQPYGGPRVDLYGSNFYGNWVQPSFSPVAPVGGWYGPNFYGAGMAPSPYRHSVIRPTYPNKVFSNTVTANGIAGTRRSVEIKHPTQGKRRMSADAVPFHIKDKQ